MREIRFRAWHRGHVNEHGRVVSPPQMLYDKKCGDCLVYLAQGQPVEVMQFAGLIDRNGRDIYEGDVLRAKEYNDTWDDGAIGDVTFEEGMFRFNWKILLAKSGKRDYRTPISTICSSAGYNSDKRDGGIKVIGNIYESPELVTP